MCVNNELLVTVDQAASLLQVCRKTLYKLLNDYEFPSVRLGGKRLVPRKALDAYVERLLKEQNPAWILKE